MTECWNCEGAIMEQIDDNILKCPRCTSTYNEWTGKREYDEIEDIKGGK